MDPLSWYICKLDKKNQAQTVHLLIPCQNNARPKRHAIFLIPFEKLLKYIAHANHSSRGRDIVLNASCMTCG